MRSTRGVATPVGQRSSSLVVRLLLMRLVSEGHDVRALLEACGIPAADLGDERKSIDYAAVLRLWSRAEQLTRDPLLGPRTAELVDFRFIDDAQMKGHPALQLLAASATVGEGMRRCAPSFAINNRPCTLAWERTSAGAVLSVHAPELPAPVSSYHEHQLAVTVRALVGFASAPLPSLRVALVRRDGDAQAYERSFRAPVSFGAARWSVFVGAADLSTPMRTSRPPGVVRALERAFGDGVRCDGEVVDRVRDVLSSRMESGVVGFDEISRALALTPRTLARRLRDHGTGYKQLLDEVRAERARQYLVEGTLPINDIAALLAFAEPSTFHRAFRRWFGEGPSSFRRRLTREVNCVAARAIESDAAPRLR